MCQQAALHRLRVPRCHNLVPHETNAINLVLLNTTSDVLVHHHKALVLSRSVIDYDLAPSLVIGVS